MNPKLLLCGFTRSGKTTAAEIAARIIGGKAVNMSDYIIADYAKANGHKENWVINHKEELRKKLFVFARAKQKIDPLYPMSAALDDADVVTGARNKDEITASNHLLDLIIWIDRPGILKGDTDKIGPEDADIIILNDGTIEELEQKIRILTEFRC